MRRRLAIQAGVVLALVAVAGILFLLYVHGTFRPSVSGQLKKVEKGAEPAWYAGERVAGLKLTAVEPGKGTRVASFGYGSCHRVGTWWNPFSPTTCGFPLLVQTWRIDGNEITSDYIPSYVDGTCGRLDVRGVPAATGTNGVILYTGDEAVAVLGPAELVHSAIAALRPAGRPLGRLPRPTTQTGALGNCNRTGDPFEPLGTRLRRLLRGSSLPLVTAGDWFQDGQLTSAEETGRTVALEYQSCRAHSGFDNCAVALSIDVEPVSPTAVSSDLRGAKCERFAVGGAPGVVWNKHLSSGDTAGIYLFTSHAVVSTAKDFTLENIDMGKLRAAARSLRPLDASTLPAPSFDPKSLLGLCAQTKAL